MSHIPDPGNYPYRNSYVGKNAEKTKRTLDKVMCDSVCEKFLGGLPFEKVLTLVKNEYPERFI